MKYYGATDIGLVRKTNQDNYVIAYNKSNDVFAIVCDGIGGGRGGDIASKMAIDYFSKAFGDNIGFLDIEEAKTWVRYHVSKCNEAIYLKSVTTSIYKGMGTTFVGVLITKVGKLVVNVGDSRVYGLNKNNDFLRFTIDHTYVQDMVRHGEITLEEAKNHPKKNMLTNAMGAWSNIRVDIDVCTNDIKNFLVCSDGLSSYVDHDVIESIMKNEDLTVTLKVRRLLNSALRAGGYDNITIIVIEFMDEDFI